MHPGEPMESVESDDDGRGGDIMFPVRHGGKDDVGIDADTSPDHRAPMRQKFAARTPSRRPDALLCTVCALCCLPSARAAELWPSEISVALTMSQVYHESMRFYLLAGFATLIILVVGFCLGFCCGKRCTRAASRTFPPTADPVDIEMHTKQTQAQTTYTYYNNAPRFKPLASYENGCWDR